MKRLSGKLTYANVVATLALFLVLAGGSAFAAKTMLPKNSVGSKQIKNNAVTGPKIKNGAVTGAKIAPGSITGTSINSSSLGTVPDAAHAGTADKATTASAATKADSATTATVAANANALGGVPPSGYASSQLEAPHIVGAAGQPVLEGGCVNLSAEFEPTGFYKDPFGIVHLQGGVEACTAVFGETFVLPAGFRPAGNQIFIVHGVDDNEAGTVRVDPDGRVERFQAKEALLNGLTFRAAG
ncbi:MAG TPA: hypothetical protein VJ204_05345 [Solirubrobacterales bacterium]|nr:hypothetical protein [Solirubrobacterales bacterium]